MSNRTYTAEGTFDRNENAIINVCISAEPSKRAYRTEMYNMSKITSNGSINVIFCHFSDGSSVEMQHDTFDYQLKFNLADLKNHPGAVDFDENKDDALFIFFHDEKFERSDREIYLKKVEETYEFIKRNGNQSQDGLLSLSTNVSLSSPRKVGLSLISKLRS